MSTLRHKVALISAGAAVLIGVIAAIAYPKWREGADTGGQKPAEPFRIAGNLYYVGANDIASFLITGPNGHVLIDGGYPNTPPLIIASIRKLGFDIKDVKILLESHAHFDHVAGLAALQKASGAQMWVSQGDEYMLRHGGDDPSLGLLRLMIWKHISGFEPPRIDHVFKDGDTVRVGPVELVAHVTPGHTPGCTSWAIPVHDAGRDLLAVDVCSLQPAVSFGVPKRKAELARQLEQSFATLRALPGDILLTPHAREFGRYRKFVEQQSAKDPAAPFINPAEYRAYIDSAEAKVRRSSSR